MKNKSQMSKLKVRKKERNNKKRRSSQRNKIKLNRVI